MLHAEAHLLRTMMRLRGRAAGFARPLSRACARPFSSAGEDGELTKLVKDQYDSEGAVEFYRTVMGGGDGNIHYGLVLKDGDERDVSVMSENTVSFMHGVLEMSSLGRVAEGAEVLDVGSGHGGAAHSTIKRFGCQVTGFNLCGRQNRVAEEAAAALGVGDRFATVEGNFDEDGLPEPWTDRFDAVWSEEVFCHSRDKPALLGQIHRVLKPDGSLVFSDIMAGEHADAEQLRTFTDRNATAVMFRPSDYLAALGEAGFMHLSYVDLTEHLPVFCQGMINQIDNARAEMVQKGVDDGYIQNFRDSLDERIGACADGCFAWGVFAAKKGAGRPAGFSAAGRSAGGVRSHAVSGRTFATAPSGSRSSEAPVVVVGAGRLGTFIASRAAANLPEERDYFLKTRTDHAPSSEAAAVLRSSGVRTVDELPQGVDPGVFVVTTKTYDQEAACQDIADLLEERASGGGAPGTVPAVCLVYNGYKEEPKCLEGLAEVVPCVTRGGFNFNGDAMVVRNEDLPWLLPDAPSAEPVARFLNDSGIAATAHPEFEWLRLEKYIVNCVGNLLSVVTASTCEGLFNDHRRLLEQLFDELYDVLQDEPLLAGAWAHAPPRRELLEKTLHCIRSYGGHFPSTKQDFDAGNRLEIDSLNGFILQSARRRGLDAAMHTLLVDTVRSMEKGRDADAPSEIFDDMAHFERMVNTK